MGAQLERDAEFTDYVRTHAAWLRKVAYLLCGDWHRADDLVQAAVTKLFASWQRARGASNLDGYVRRTLVNTFLAEQRSAWWRLVDLKATDDDAVSRDADRDAVIDLRLALTMLPARQRATIVLRYYCDLPIDDVARTLDCSTGTVKSQTSHAITALRRRLRVEHAPTSQEG